LVAAQRCSATLTGLTAAAYQLKIDPTPDWHFPLERELPWTFICAASAS
jgi:hypothetical protein